MSEPDVQLIESSFFLCLSSGLTLGCLNPLVRFGHKSTQLISSMQVCAASILLQHLLLEQDISGAIGCQVQCVTPFCFYACIQCSRVRAPLCCLILINDCTRMQIFCQLYIYPCTGSCLCTFFILPLEMVGLNCESYKCKQPRLMQSWPKLSPPPNISYFSCFIYLF